MDPRLAAEIARSLDADPALLPHLAELFADVEGLGSDPAGVVELLRPLGLPRGARAIDLGCGKGAVALALARQLGLRVDGVDAFEPFVRAAEERARSEGLADLCRFRSADLRSALAGSASYELALLLGLGDVLGGPRETVALVRAVVRPGGWILIDDAYLADESEPAALGDPRLGRDASRRELESWGDRIEAEIAVEPERLAEIEAEIAAKLAARAAALAVLRPELAGALRVYLEAQESAAERLRGAVVPVTWLLRRGGDRSS